MISHPATPVDYCYGTNVSALLHHIKQSPEDLFGWCMEIARATGAERWASQTSEPLVLRFLKPGPPWTHRVSSAARANANTQDVADAINELAKNQHVALTTLSKQAGRAPTFNLALLFLIAVADEMAVTNRTPMQFLTPSHGSVVRRTLAPTVGVTLSRLSHTLAYSPNSFAVAASQRTVLATPAPDELRVLFLPFPDKVNPAQFNMTQPDSFEYAPPSNKRALNYFTKVSADRTLPDPDLILAPELAFRLEAAEVPWAQTPLEPLRRRFPNAIIACGVQDMFGNLVRLDLPGFASPVLQYKHHPWYLDRQQAHSYSIPWTSAHSRIPENMRIWQRELQTIAFDCGTTFNFLICEDLTRFEPVGAHIAAACPSLVIAHLLDAAQIPMRWPGRAAARLHEDAGSSVLSITASGMVRAHVRGRGRRACQIGLFTSAEGMTNVIDARTEKWVWRTYRKVSVHNTTLDGRTGPARFSYTV